MKILSRLLFYSLITLFVANIGYAIYEKPWQILHPISKQFKKVPYHTWQEYQADFQKYASPQLSASFLAALAQSESAGNPWATVYWQVNLSREIYRIFHPASSALGLYQITQGTMKEMKKYCWENGKAIRGNCFWNRFRMRLSSYDSIYLTSAYLNYWVNRFPEYRNKEKMAALIHLCGIEKVRRHMHRYGKVSKIQRCGSHRIKNYLSRIRSYQSKMQQLASR
tara:strand:+ start:367 stop:1038 length:672 start_codon:yes stop_codon:yes gene_type:complete